MSSFTDSLSLLLLLFLYALMSPFIPQAQALFNHKAGSNDSFSAIFVFGDSTVDPGNNNYIGTPFKSNFPPYGRDFPNQVPTGRFTNGKLVTDFIASFLGIKDYVPPYLNKSLSLEELITGVSFASGGSGYDPLTPQITGVIQITKQLEYFREYKTKLELAIGKKRTENHIRNAVVIISAGTNDFVINYFIFPVRRQRYTVANYQHFLLQNLRQFLQGLWELGARRIAVAGLPLMGCLPFVITLNSHNAFLQRRCINSYSLVAKEYNQKLQYELAAMQKNFASDETRIIYMDIYQPLIDMIQSPDKYGFEESRFGCCGTGMLEVSFLCNRHSLVCADASKYIFWDSIHPTEKTCYLIFNTISDIFYRFLK